jgi:CheY-like chemotaxis protein
LAEDNETNIETITDYLLDKGYRVTVARNGREVLERMEEALPDIVLMDIQMPDVDGLEAIRHIRDNDSPAFATIPIIALTALAMPGDRDRCLEAGADEYLSKPVSMKGLSEIIEAQLRRSRGEEP